MLKNGLGFQIRLLNNSVSQQ